jgi:hypothetical protein
MLPIHNATRYIVPLREGGSLPAILDTADGGSYVVKFRGAGQGARALVAEIIVGHLAATLGFDIPSLALIELDESFGRSEPDSEIQDILRGSRGLNVGLRYLEGAFTYDPVALNDVDPERAAAIVWLDALTTNIDRTARNPNLLYWNDRLWLIDHGAALYFHHNWASLDDDRKRTPFAPISQHVLLRYAGDIREADARLAPLVTSELLRETVELIPDDLLMDAPSGTEPAFSTPDENRAAYIDYFTVRLGSPREFAAEAERARQRGRTEPVTRVEARR